MAEGHLLQFHEDMEACVTRIVNTMRVTWPNGCKLGDKDQGTVPDSCLSCEYSILWEGFEFIK